MLCIVWLLGISMNSAFPLSFLAPDFFFDFGKADLRPAGRIKLDSLAKDLLQFKGGVIRIVIVGYTDNKEGTVENYLLLGQRRADTVADYLVVKGVLRSSISTQSMGDAEPVAPNTLPNGEDNPAGRALNRRVRVDIAVESDRVDMINQ